MDEGQNSRRGHGELKRRKDGTKHAAASGTGE